MIKTNDQKCASAQMSEVLARRACSVMLASACTLLMLVVLAMLLSAGDVQTETNDRWRMAKMIRNFIQSSHATAAPAAHGGHADS